MNAISRQFLCFFSVAKLALLFTIIGYVASLIYSFMQIMIVLPALLPPSLLSETVSSSLRSTQSRSIRSSICHSGSHFILIILAFGSSMPAQMHCFRCQRCFALERQGCPSVAGSTAHRLLIRLPTRSSNLLYSVPFA